MRVKFRESVDFAVHVVKLRPCPVELDNSENIFFISF